MTAMPRSGRADGGARHDAVRWVAIAVGGIVLLHATLVALLPGVVCLEHLPEDPPRPEWFVVIGAMLTPASWIAAWTVGRGEPTRRRAALGGLSLTTIATFVWLALAAARLPVSRYCT